MRSNRVWIGGLAVVITACCWAKAVPVRAAEVLDQHNDVDMSATADSASPFAVETGQTFTVGVAGALSRIELQINRLFGTGGTVIFTLYNTSGGIPNASLGTTALNWDAIPSGGFAYQSFDISAFSIPVTVGEVMAFTIKSSGETGFGLRSTFTLNTYSGGESKWRLLGTPPGPWQTFSPSHDNGFKTYVLAAAAGLPGDYNSNNIVDAADYTVWRDSLGQAGTDLAADGTGPGGMPDTVVDSLDYDFWKEHFGMTADSSSYARANAAIPEPSTFALLMFAAATWRLRRGRAT